MGDGDGNGAAGEQLPRGAVAGALEGAAQLVRPTLEEKAETRYALAYVVDQARAAAGRVYDAAGANATYDRSPLQKLFRDLNIGSHHATMDHDHCALQYGRVRLGLKPEVTI